MIIMKKVLLITHHFPPDAAMGAVRPAKFAKYLPQFGWEPIILTVKENYHQVLDEPASGQSHLSPKVIRTRMFRSPSYYYRKLKRVFQRDHVGSDINRSVNHRRGENPRVNFRQVIKLGMSYPDEQAGWLPFALLSGLKIIRQEGINVLITTGPPHSVHLIGSCLSKVTQTPWIGDYRDPYFVPELDNPLERKLDRKLEAHFLSHSAFTLATTQRFTERLVSRYPECKQKILTLLNGYDPDDFSGIPKKKEKRFTISYLGTFYFNRDPEPVLHAVSDLIREGQIDPRRLMLRFIGDCSSVAGKPTDSLIAKYHLTDNVEVSAWLPRWHALQTMVRSHVLLLLAEQQPLMIPGKLYEYFGAGSDILALTGDGATADLLRQTRRGVVISPDDYPMLKAKIKTFYLKYSTNSEYDKDDSISDTDPLTKYSRVHQTGELARILETATASYLKKKQ